jgi:CHAD domain-containing protein
VKDDPALTAGPYLGARLRTLEERLRTVVPRIVSSAQDDDSVHDLRVALRRARTVLEVGRRVLGPFHCDEVRRALRTVQRATGVLRDEEVLLGLVASVCANDLVLATNLAGWIDLRRRRERGLRRALTRSIATGDLDRACRLLDALLAFRVEPSRDRPLTKLARKSMAKASRRVERLRVSSADDPPALHELRIAYKRLRYVVETFSETLPDEVAGLAQRAARLQNRLGAVHDVDVVVGCVRRARSLSIDARRQLLEALERARAERIAIYAKDAGVLPPAHDATHHASGTDALRKTSTR